MATNLRVTNQSVEVLGEGGGNLRVSGQVVEVMGTEAGTLRVTSQLVEVLASVDSFSALNALAFTQTATAKVERNISVTDTLSLTHLAVGEGSAPPVGTTYEESVSDTLDFQQAMGWEKPKEATDEEVLSFIDEATCVRTIPITVVDHLNFVQTIEQHGPISVSVTQKLNLSDDEDEHIPEPHLSAENILDLRDRAGQIFTITVADAISFVDRAGRIIPKSVADVLTFTQSTSFDQGVIAKNTIVFTDIARYSVDRAIGADDLDGIQAELGFTDKAEYVLVPAIRRESDDTLTLTDAVTLVADYTRSAAHTLGLKDAVAFTVVSPDVTSYKPFVGSSSDPNAPAPPPATLEYISQGTGFKLFYPPAAPTQTLTIRAPDLGNKDRLAFNRISRETRGGTLIVFADPIWPKIQTLALSFSGLRSVEIQTLLSFMETYLGKEIGIIDWEGRAWRGVITQPDEQAVQNGKDNYSISFEFEGELDPNL